MPAAQAGWEKVGTNDAGDHTAYVDRGTKQANGSVVRIWEMTDLSGTATLLPGMHYRSSKTHNEYNCKTRVTRYRTIVFYAGNMGTGAVVHSSDIPGNWQDIVPDSADEHKWRIVCRTK